MAPKTSWIDFEPRTGKSGLLVAIEATKQVPFRIERVYYVLGADPSVTLGRHAHRRGEQVLVCLTGSCRLTLDDGRSTEEFVLDRPDRGLLVGPLLWEEFRLSVDAVLLVLCSTPYEAGDQIEDRDEFLSLVGRRAVGPHA